MIHSTALVDRMAVSNLPGLGQLGFLTGTQASNGLIWVCLE